MAKMDDVLAEVQQALDGLSDLQPLIVSVGHLRELLRAAREGGWICDAYTETIWNIVLDEGVSLEDAILAEAARYDGR